MTYLSWTTEYRRTKDKAYPKLRVAQRKRYNMKHTEEKRVYCKVRHQHIRESLNELKTLVGCQLCGWNGDPCVLDFHHINPSTKTRQVGITYAWTKDYIEELNSCAILCANCHRLVHKSSQV